MLSEVGDTVEWPWLVSLSCNIIYSSETETDREQTDSSGEEGGVLGRGGAVEGLRKKKNSWKCTTAW